MARETFNEKAGSLAWQRRGKHDIAQTHHTAQMMQRHLHLFFVLDIHAQGIVSKMQVGVWRHYIQRIEYLARHLVLKGWQA